jgi:intraflagellar transport protein 122
MYIKAGRYERAMPLLIRHAWWDRLLSLVRTLDKERHTPLLSAAAAALRRAGQLGAAKEALLKLEDAAGLVDLAVASERWEDAELLAVAHPELAARVHLPRARWLCARDRWVRRGGLARTPIFAPIYKQAWDPSAHLATILQSSNEAEISLSPHLQV